MPKLEAVLNNGPFTRAPPRVATSKNSAASKPIWIESFKDVKILKKILMILAKVLKDASPLSIYLEMKKFLRAFVV